MYSTVIYYYSDTTILKFYVRLRFEVDAMYSFHIYVYSAEDLMKIKDKQYIYYSPNPITGGFFYDSMRINNINRYWIDVPIFPLDQKPKKT